MDFEKTYSITAHRDYGVNGLLLMAIQSCYQWSDSGQHSCQKVWPVSSRGLLFLTFMVITSWCSLWFGVTRIVVSWSPFVLILHGPTAFTDNWDELGHPSGARTTAAAPSHWEEPADVALASGQVGWLGRWFRHAPPGGSLGGKLALRWLPQPGQEQSGIPCDRPPPTPG